MPNAADTQGYDGAERRTRVLYVTENTEYHFSEGLCVAVRERRTGNWLLTHPVLNRPLSGSVRFNRNLEAYPTLDDPRVGEGLFFGSAGPEVVTSNLRAIARPEKRVVENYPA
jgi:hypothetical protein